MEWRYYGPNSRVKSHFEKLTVAPLVEIFPSFYWTRRFLAGAGRSHSRRTDTPKIWLYKIIEIHTAVDSVPVNIPALLCFRFKSPNSRSFYLNLRVIQYCLKSTVKFLNCSWKHCAKKKNDVSYSNSFRKRVKLSEADSYINNVLALNKIASWSQWKEKKVNFLLSKSWRQIEELQIYPRSFLALALDAGE